MKYYAVKNGREPGIYKTWTECQKQIHGFKNASYKSFSTLEEAEQFIQEKKEMPKIENGLIAYVDGSFNAKKKIYGYGAVLIEGQKVIQRLSGQGNHPDCLPSRNVAGEIFGSLAAVKYAVEHPEYDGIIIYYDYMGIEKWATGEWKANKKLTQYYVSQMNHYQKQISILFMKVEAHTGDFYNEQADKLAKKAVGIE